MANYWVSEWFAEFFENLLEFFFGLSFFGLEHFSKCPKKAWILMEFVSFVLGWDDRPDWVPRRTRCRLRPDGDSRHKKGFEVPIKGQAGKSLQPLLKEVHQIWRWISSTTVPRGLTWIFIELYFTWKLLQSSIQSHYANYPLLGESYRHQSQSSEGNFQNTISHCPYLNLMHLNMHNASIKLMLRCIDISLLTWAFL